MEFKEKLLTGSYLETILRILWVESYQLNSNAWNKLEFSSFNLEMTLNQVPLIGKSSHAWKQFQGVSNNE